MNVLSISIYIIGQIRTHKAQCFHWMRMPPLEPPDEIDDIPLNNKTELHPDANAVEEAEICDKNLP